MVLDLKTVGLFKTTLQLENDVKEFNSLIKIHKGLKKKLQVIYKSLSCTSSNDLKESCKQEGQTSQHKKWKHCFSNYKVTERRNASLKSLCDSRPLFIYLKFVGYKSLEQPQLPVKSFQKILWYKHQTTQCISH